MFVFKKLSEAETTVPVDLYGTVDDRTDRPPSAKVVIVTLEPIAATHAVVPSTKNCPEGRPRPMAMGPRLENSGLARQCVPPSSVCKRRRSVRTHPCVGETRAMATIASGA